MQNISLKELIKYWEDRLLEHPPITSPPEKDIVNSTIGYLKELDKLRELGVRIIEKS